MKKDKAVRNAEMKEAVVSRLKSMIVPFLILLVIGGLFAYIMLYQETPEEEEIIRANAYEGEEQEIVLENDRLKFVMDSATTQFSLTVKDTGMVWYSNPPDAANDPKALTLEKGNLQSTLMMVYSTTNGVDTIFNNYDYSMENQIYEIEPSADSIRVNYTIGKLEKEFVIPPVIPKERMEAYQALMSKSDAVMVNQYYKEYDINNLSKRDQEKKDELLANYPILETQVCYVIRENATENIRNKMQQIFESVGYTYEEYLEDRELGTAGSTRKQAVFNISMIYRLEGDDLVVEVPMGDIEFLSDYPIYTMTILPYFGAGGVDEQGYLLVPEGGGALINFNNGKIAQSNYYANLYGWDMATNRKALVHDTMAYYGVFGVSKGDNAFLCMLEDGAAYASIQADVSGKTNSYNYVNAVYSMSHREQYDVGDRYNGMMFVYEEELPDESLVQRYRFADTGSYVELADVYHDYLAAKHPEQFTPLADESAPAAIELLGAVDKVEQVLGVPVDKPIKLTSFTEAQEILSNLQNAGFGNLYVKLSGWANGGIKQKLFTKIKPVSALGGTKALKSLISYAKDNGVELYLDGVTDYAYNSNILNGFIVFTDAARLASQERVELYDYSKITFGQMDYEDPYYLLSHENIDKMADNLIGYAAANGAGVSFRNMGSEVSSDFDETDLQTRQKQVAVQVSKFEKAKQAGEGIMINEGNDYAMPYADMITNMDLGGSEYTILDRMVPFYQLAVHGFANYTGEPLNMVQDYENELLKSAEYGAGLAFTFMKETAFAIQSTDYTKYFGAGYDSWKDKAAEIYNRYNSELGHTFNQRMTDHKYLTDMVTCTSYEDGTKVYVNYSYEDYRAEDGTNVPARDYVAVRQ